MYLDTQYYSDLTAQEREEVYELVECYVNLIFKNKLKSLPLACFYSRNLGNILVHLNAIDKAIDFNSKKF